MNKSKEISLTPEQAIEAAKKAKEQMPASHRFEFGHGKMTKRQAARVRLLAREDLHEWALLDETEGMLDTEEIQAACVKANFKPPRSRGVILAPRINLKTLWVYYQNPASTVRWMVHPDGMVYINAFKIDAQRNRSRFLSVAIDPADKLKRSNWHTQLAQGELDTLIDVVDLIRSLGVDESELRRALAPVFRDYPAARIKAEYVEDDGGQLWVFLDDEDVAADIKLEEEDEASVRFFGNEEGLMDPTLLEALEPRINEVLRNCGQKPLDLRID